MADRPADAPPLNSFLVWRGNKVGSNGGFGLGVDAQITPGDDEKSSRNPLAEQPRLAEVVLEGNSVADSPVPLGLGSGITGLFGRGNSFEVPTTAS